MGRAFSTYGVKDKCIEISVEKIQGKTGSVRSSRRWENNIKIDLNK
jgi:hypothetical protein